MPRFEIQTRMVRTCPKCGASAPHFKRFDTRTEETVVACPACGQSEERTDQDHAEREETGEEDD
jgi:endogenous inhibitor of DNA gyrase (YacG/DUF329 family)